MGLFLHGKWITAGVVFVGFAIAVFMFSYYIWILAHHVSFPTVLTKVVAIFSMLFWLAWGLQSLATCHSIHQKSKQLSFGRWSIMSIVSISFDMLYFGMMVNYSGFQYGHLCSTTKRDGGLSGSMCSHRAAAIGLAVAMFITAIYRLFCLLVVWHWDVRWNQTQAATNNAPTPATPAELTKTKAQSLPKRRGRRSKPSINVSDYEEEVQLFPAASSPLHAHDFDSSSSDSDLDSVASAFHTSSSEEEQAHLHRKSRTRL